MVDKSLPANWSQIWAQRVADAQATTEVRFVGIPYRRVPYSASDPEGQSAKCVDCGVTHGMLHVHNCRVERCAICGGQRICCGCEDGGALEVE